VSISRQQALAVFHKRYPPSTVHHVEITDKLPSRCGIYNPPRACWFVLFAEQDTARLESSRLVAVSKSTGEIVYDGSSNDEG
jgi:hypothetical protein